MDWFKKTDEEKQRISKIKVSQCENFSEFLTKNRVSHQVNNNGYHIQVQIQHNFYPSRKSYYNSVSGKKCHYPKFETIDDFYKFIQKNVK